MKEEQIDNPYQHTFRNFFEIPNVGGIVMQFQQTGRRYDEESGLYYYRARMYSPEMSRFTSNDPAKQGENWYAYVGNNPVNSRDPSGKMWGDLESLAPIIQFLHGSGRGSSIYSDEAKEAKKLCSCGSKFVNKYYGKCGYFDYVLRNWKKDAYHKQCYRDVYWEKVISQRSIARGGARGGFLGSHPALMYIVIA